jgi:3'-5' exoribonuclease
MKKVYVKEIQAGDFVDDIFILAEKTLSQKKDGKNYLNVSVSDKTGTLKGVMWDGLDDVVLAVAAGDYVKIKGNVSEYKGTLQLVVKSIAGVDSQRLSPADFLPSTARDVDQMFHRLGQLSDSISNPPIKALVEAFFRDEEFVNALKTAPAAKNMHHAYLGGLLEHTLSMTLLAEKISGHYGGLDRDLLMAGAILHDIGKVRELSFTTHIDYTDEGRFLSHIVIGVLMVREKIIAIKNFPKETEQLIEHMIISHHGAREFGSPEPPKTIEAVLLHYIDEIDARVNGIREFVESENAGENWTSYHRLLERHFYTKTHQSKTGSPQPDPRHG